MVGWGTMECSFFVVEDKVVGEDLGLDIVEVVQHI